MHTNLANARGELGHYITRLKLFADIHPIILKTNNPIIIRDYNFKLGGWYYQLNDLDKALTHLYKGIFISDDFNWHPNFAGITETLIASTYAKQNNVDSVRKYILLADKIKRDELPVPYKARIKSLIALSLAYEGNFEEGRKLLDEAYKVASEGKDSSEMMYSEFIRGKIFAKARQYGKAIAAYNHLLDDYSEKDLGPTLRLYFWI